jgi:acyl-coenzyme A thioesterase 13
LEIPEHFEPLSTSPFSERIGPLYVERRDSVPVIGVRIAPHHANRLGRAHGGLLMTLADIALNRAVREHLPTGATLATADLHVAFLEALAQDDWVEAVPSVDRIGRALIHASCLLRSGSRDVARAMGTFAVRLG